MRPAAPALALALCLVTGSTVIAGCGDDSGSNSTFPADSGDSTTPDALPDAPPVEGAYGDGPADASDAGSEGADDALSEATLETGAPTTAVARFSVAVDASQQVIPARGCAAITSLIAAPAETSVGHAIALAASGVDPSGQSVDVVLAWSATGGAGSLAAASGPSSSLQCTSPGLETVTVTATLAEGGATCPGISSASVRVQCDP